MPARVALAALTAALLSTGAAPAARPRIVFSATDALYTMAADGSDLQRVPGSLREDDRPAPFPDGRRLVFQDTYAHLTWIVAMNVDGTHRTLLRRVDVDGGDPVVSPDGRLIAFDDIVGGRWGIYVMSPSGRNVRRVVSVGDTSAFPEWTPDDRIVFGTTTDDRALVMVVPVDGGVGTTFDTGGLAVWNADLSPDGRTLVAAVGSGGRDTELYAFTAGTPPLRLTHNAYFDGDPSWSPDGTRIVFDTGRKGWGEIYSMNPDGSDQTRLTYLTRGEAWVPRWLPQPG
jgi:Tol biopolymer transport system component